MFVRGLEARAHCINGDVRCPQFLPCLCLANPLVEASIAYGQAGFDAQRSGVAARLSGVAAQAFDGLGYLVVGIALRKQPSPRRATRRSRVSASPPNHIGMDRRAGSGFSPASVMVW